MVMNVCLGYGVACTVCKVCRKSVAWDLVRGVWIRVGVMRATQGVRARSIQWSD